MTPNELASAGRTLYGERWQTALATDLQVADRTMRRWLAGETTIPGGVERELRQILIARLTAIGNLVVYRVISSNQSVFHYPSNAVFRYDDFGNVMVVYPGLGPLEMVAQITAGAKEAVRQERERDKEIAEKFIRSSAWWLTHSSHRPVRAPGHADRIYLSHHGWAVNFGANSFLVGKAIERCRKVLDRNQNEAEAGQVVSRSQIRGELQKVISGCVANSSGEEYGGYYPTRDDNTLVFGAQGIGVDDGANFMIGESNLRWDGDVLATPQPSASAEAKSAPTEHLPFNPVLLTPITHLDWSVRTENCLKNDKIVYVGDLVQRTEAEMLRTPNFGRKSLNETKEVLAQMGLHLGMEVPDWPPQDIENLAQAYDARLET